MENEYPYTSGRSQRHDACKIPNPINNVVRGKLNIRNVRPRTEAEMAEMLVAKGPVIVSIAADNEYMRFFNDFGNGIFDNNSSVVLNPNHAVILTGYGTENGTDY